MSIEHSSVFIGDGHRQMCKEIQREIEDTSSLYLYFVGYLVYVDN